MAVVFFQKSCFKKFLRKKAIAVHDTDEKSKTKTSEKRYRIDQWKNFQRPNFSTARLSINMKKTQAKRVDCRS